MVPYMMKDVYQLSTAEIGSVIIFPGTMSVIIFGYIGGILMGPLKKGLTIKFVTPKLDKKSC